MDKEKKELDILIIGAGACGLMAASEMAGQGFRIAIVEAKDRTGGRIYTLSDAGFSLPVEAGAEFIHGKLPLTMNLIRQSDGRFNKLDGDSFQVKEGRLTQEDLFAGGNKIKEVFSDIPSDCTVSDFVRNFMSGEDNKELGKNILTYVEGYHAADPEKASSKALLKDFFSGEEEDFRVENGYARIIRLLRENIMSKGCELFLSQPVENIIRAKDHLIIHTSSTIFTASKVLITVSLGCLQRETIRFTPSLPHIREAANQAGFGAVIKILMEFETAFWLNYKDRDLSRLSFLFSEESIPVWWTRYPSPVPLLTGWLGGPAAEKMKDLPDNEIIGLGIQSLSNIFNFPEEMIRSQLKASAVANWNKDPYINGAYSFEVVNGNEFKNILRKPVEERIFFAGEALQDGVETGTVEAALKSGKEAARLMLRTFQKKIP